MHRKYDKGVLKLTDEQESTNASILHYYELQKKKGRTSTEDHYENGCSDGSGFSFKYQVIVPADNSNRRLAFLIPGESLRVGQRKIIPL